MEISKFCEKKANSTAQLEICGLWKTVGPTYII